MMFFITINANIQSNIMLYEKVCHFLGEKCSIRRDRKADFDEWNYLKVNNYVANQRVVQ